MALTDIECKRAQAKDKSYRLSDSNGLSLQVNTNGSKYWNLRFTVDGQRRSESIGKYPEIGLKKARELAYELKIQMTQANGLNKYQLQFKDVAEDWFNSQKETWSVKHIANVRASLDELNISLGNKQIDQIVAPGILKAIKKIEARGSLVWGIHLSSVEYPMSKSLAIAAKGSCSLVKACSTTCCLNSGLEQYTAKVSHFYISKN